LDCCLSIAMITNNVNRQERKHWLIWNQLEYYIYIALTFISFSG
jgi:hypothetical protein